MMTIHSDQLEYIRSKLDQLFSFEYEHGPGPTRHEWALKDAIDDLITELRRKEFVEKEN